MRWWIAGVPLVGCAPEPIEEPEVEEPDVSWAADLEEVMAPWDPLFFWRSGRDRVRVAPVVLDADGQQRRLVPVADATGVYAWRPEPPLEPGSFVARAPGEPDIVVPFEVGPYGVADDFDGDAILGVPWEVSFSDSVDMVGPTDLLLSVLPPLWLVVDELGPPGRDGSRSASFHAVTDGDGGVCRFLQEEGTLSPEGLLTWEKERIEAQTSGAPILVQDLELRVGWDPEASEAAGVEFRATVETASIESQIAEPPEICGLLLSIGVPCWDCAGLGDTCAETWFHRGRLVADPDVAWAATDVAPCPFDVGAANGAYSCDLSGLENLSLCNGLVLPFVGTGLFFARRRRARSRAGRELGRLG